VSDWLSFNVNSNNFSAISWEEQINFQWDDDEVHYVLDQHGWLDFYSASSLKKPPQYNRNIVESGIKHHQPTTETTVLV
jgi:hypothetical protein